MAAPIAPTAQTEPAAERLGRGRELPAPRLAWVVAAMQRAPAVSAWLLGRPLHDRLVDRHQPLKELASQLERVEHLHLRSRQLGGEPLGTTLNKFSEGLRLSAPRET
jgi:hypothetical protein